MYLNMAILRILIEERVLSLGSIEFTKAAKRYVNTLLEIYNLGGRINLDNGVIEKSDLNSYAYKVCSESFLELLDTINEIPTDSKVCGIKLLSKIYPGQDLKFYKELWEFTRGE